MLNFICLSSPDCISLSVLLASRCLTHSIQLNRSSVPLSGWWFPAAAVSAPSVKDSCELSLLSWPTLHTCLENGIICFVFYLHPPQNKAAASFSLPIDLPGDDCLALQDALPRVSGLYGFNFLSCSEHCLLSLRYHTHWEFPSLGKRSWFYQGLYLGFLLMAFLVMPLSSLFF